MFAIFNDEHLLPGNILAFENDVTLCCRTHHHYRYDSYVFLLTLTQYDFLTGDTYDLIRRIVDCQSDDHA